MHDYPHFLKHAQYIYILFECEMVVKEVLEIAFADTL